MSNSPGVNFHPGLTGLKIGFHFPKPDIPRPSAQVTQIFTIHVARLGPEGNVCAGMEVSKKTCFFHPGFQSQSRNPWLIALRYHPKRFDLNWICRECRGSHPPTRIGWRMMKGYEGPGKITVSWVSWLSNVAIENPLLIISWYEWIFNGTSTMQ